MICKKGGKSSETKSGQLKNNSGEEIFGADKQGIQTSKTNHIVT